MRLRIQLRDVVPLLRDPAGRRQLFEETQFRLWPLIAPIAQLHRRTLLARTPVVVVVGSQGKSTSVRAVRAALGFTPSTWVEANAGAEVAVQLLRGRPWDKGVVLEVGIGARGQMESYAQQLRPSHVVVTSIGTEHATTLGTREEIRAEKARMVEGVPSAGVVFLNADDEHVMWMAGRTRARIVTFGFSPHADVRASGLRLRGLEGIELDLHVGGRTRATRTRLLSKDLVRAFLAGVAVALRLGEPLDAVIARLEALPPTPRRLDPRPLPSGAWLIRDEYKSSLETVDSALDVFEALEVSGRRFVVLGEISEPPGSQGPIYRRIGARIAAIADQALFVGGNFQRYAAGARRAGMTGERVVDAGRSWRVAFEHLRRELGPGDVVLVKGRDTQRLDRVSLALLGRDVRCARTECELIDCDGCPMLERRPATSS